MARRATIRDTQILEAARHVFLSRGITATTAEVAARAGVSEGSVFNRFQTKQALFCAAMHPTMEEPPWLAILAHDGDDPRRTLFEAGREAVVFFRALLPIMMMTWSNSAATGTLPDVMLRPDPPPLRALDRLKRFFEREMKAKRLRRSDSEILARVFLGALQSFVLIELLSKAHAKPLLDEQRYLRGLIGLIWDGVASRVVKTKKQNTQSAKKRPSR